MSESSDGKWGCVGLVLAAIVTGIFLLISQRIIPFPFFQERKMEPTPIPTIINGRPRQCSDVFADWTTCFICSF